MRYFARCVVTGITLTGALAGMTIPAIAAPRPVPAAARTLPLRLTRPTNGPLLHAAAIPVFREFSLRPVTVPIRAMPIFVRAHPVSPLGFVLPRVGFATLWAPLIAGACPAARRSPQIEAISPTPSFTGTCTRRDLGVDERSLPPTSLVAGHNKDALYGRAYSPAGTIF